MPRTPLDTLINLGPSMVRHLHEVGIESAEELEKVGYLDAYLRIRFLNPRVMNRMALYALYGALTNQNCMMLPKAIKDKLNRELERAKKT
jgi:hypothetical protein